MAVFTAIGASVAAATGLAWLGTATAAALQAAAGVAISLIGKSMQGEPEPARFGVQGKLQGGEDVPRSINLGWNCSAGSLVWHNTFGSGGTMSARVIALGDLPIRELLYPIVGGVDCTLRKNDAHDDYGWPVAEYRKDGKDHLWIKFYDGTQTQADEFLVDEFGDDDDRPYQASRVGNGTPYVIVFARAPERNDEGDKPLFQGIPDIKFVTNGVRWYNPAQDGSIGGAGTHRWNNPGTWGGVGDHNPVVQAYNLMRGVRYAGQWLYGMQVVSAARLPATNWIAGINAAQAAIDGPDGAEPTYRAGGEIQVGAQLATTVEALLTAANARLVEVGGAYKIFVGPPGAPVMAFTDGDILSTEEQSFSPFLRLADTVTGLVASYPNPREGWNEKKYTKLRPDLEPSAGNRRLTAPVSFDLVPYRGQVQRLVKWGIKEGQRARRHTFVLGPEFRQLEAGDVVRWSSARNGYENKLFRVDGLVYKANLDVLVDLTEVDPADYDWNQGADFTPVIDGPLHLVGPKPMPMLGWQVFPATIDGRRPSIEVWSAASLPGVQRVRVQVRVGSEAGQLIFDSDAQPYADPWRWILQGQFPPNTPCVVRGIFIGPAAATWSGWLSVTTPDTRMSIQDMDDEFRLLTGVLDGEGSLSEQFDRLLVQLDDLAEATLKTGVTGEFARRELKAEQEGNRAYFVEQVTVLVDADQALSSQITALGTEFDGNFAFVGEQLEALSDADSAMAELIDEVAVDVNGVSAGGLFKMTATAGPGSWETKITARVKAVANGSTYEAGWYVLVNSDGASVFAVKASDFVFLSSGSSSHLYSPFSISGSKLKLTGDVDINGSLTLNNRLITESLLENAVTDYVITTPGGIQYDGGLLRSATIDVDNNAAVHVRLTGYQYRPESSSGNFGFYRLKLKRGSTTIAQLDCFYDDNFSQPILIETVDEPGNGERTYTGEYDSLDGNGWVDIGRCVMSLTAYKR